MSYKDLLDIVEDRSYDPICRYKDHNILINILVAAKHNKPIFIVPKFGEVDVPNFYDNGFGIYLSSSGSTGKKKNIFLSENMLEENARNAILSQRLSTDDKILTVCSLNHTGGLNAQTIPGILIGASVTIKEFNAFRFFKDLEGHTVTHLIPIMIDALSKIKNKTITSSLRLVVAGSDCIDKTHVEFWQNRGVPFMINYGMTEAGPIIINHVFSPDEDLDIFSQGVPLGTVSYCETDIRDGELYLKGPCINSSGWLKTGDCVYRQDEWIMYRGRISHGCKIIPKNYS